MGVTMQDVLAKWERLRSEAQSPMESMVLTCCIRDAKEALDGETPCGPEHLIGDDGEVVFVRRDLAATLNAAEEAALGQGMNVHLWAADVVELLPVPEHFVEIDYEWAVVKPGTPGAVAYWRFQT